MINFKNSKKANKNQIKIAKKMGVDIKKNDTFFIIEAKIKEIIEYKFKEKDFKYATEKQISFANEYGFDLRACSVMVASAFIKEICIFFKL